MRVKKLLHRIFVIVRLLSRKSRSFCYGRWLTWFGEGITLGKGVLFETHGYIAATDGARVHIGAGVHVGRRVKIVARGGTITIGDHVHIGDGSIIVAQESISIGHSTLLAEYVVIRDQDHSTAERPIRDAGFYTGPVVIGDDVWIGAKATILKGVSIGDGAVVAAHALVNHDVPAKTLVAGVPAKAIKSL